MKTLVIYHKADWDGIFSREIARKFFGENAEYLGWDYGDPVPEVSWDRDVFMIDISVDGLMHHPKLTWIDHHKSAMAKFTWDIRGYRIDGVAACRLAWQWFFRDTPGNIAGAAMPTKEDYVERRVVEPYAVQLAGEYDIWDKRNPDADVFQHAMRSQPITDHVWRELLNTAFSKVHQETYGQDIQESECMVNALLPLGRALMYSADEANASLARDVAFELEWEGLRLLAINKPRGNSRTFAAVVQPTHDALLTFYWLRNKWRVSLYHAPHRTDIDLSQIAVKHGGGGHRGACGFECAALPFHLGPDYTVKRAMDCISAAVKEQSGPGSYRDSWIANIAMPILDQRGKLDLTTPEGANAMAEILLRHFFGSE